MKGLQLGPSTAGRARDRELGRPVWPWDTNLPSTGASSRSTSPPRDRPRVALTLGLAWQMAMRCCAAGMREARQFRRVNAHLHLPTPRCTRTRDGDDPADTCQDEAVSAA